MDEADNELRAVICKLWPTIAKKNIKLHEGGTRPLLDLVVPPKNGNHKKFYYRFVTILFYIQNYMGHLVIQD